MNEMTKRVIITRDHEKSAPLIAELERYGILSYAVPVTETVYDISKTIPGTLSEYNCIAFTSANAVAAFSEISKKFGLKIDRDLKICAVGPSTSATIKKLFRAPDLESKKNDAGSLARVIIGNSADSGGLKILWPCAEDALPDFHDVLSRAGANLTRFECYRTEPCNAREIKSILEKIAQWDLVFFAAPSAVRSFSAAWDDKSSFIAAAIGPTTEKALIEAGYENVVVSGGTRVDKCAGAIVDALKIKVWS